MFDLPNLWKTLHKILNISSFWNFSLRSIVISSKSLPLTSPQKSTQSYYSRSLRTFLFVKIRIDCFICLIDYWLFGVLECELYEDGHHVILISPTSDYNRTWNTEGLNKYFKYVWTPIACSHSVIATFSS